MRRAGVGVLLSLWMGLVPGCSQTSLCNSQPETCMAKVLSGLSGSLTDQGGMIIVQLGYQQPPPDPTQIEPPSQIVIASGLTASVNLTQGTNTVQKTGETLTSVSDTSVAITLTANDVMSLTAGPLTVSVTIGSLGMAQGMFSFSKRLSFSPAITAATMYNPVSVGIHVALGLNGSGRPGDVVTNEDFVSPTLMRDQRQISAYTFSGGMIQTPGRNVVPSQNPPLLTAVSGDWAETLVSQGPPILQAWSLNSTQPQAENGGATITGTNVVAAVAANTSLVVVLTDMGFKAFSDPGTFMAGVAVENGGQANPASALLGVGDVNGDNLPDLVAITLATPQQTLVFLGNGTQLNYDPAYSQALATTLGTTTTISQLAVGNLDPTNGGLADLAVASGNTVQLIQNLGTVNFASVAVNSLTAPSEVDGLAIGDINGDGKNDLALCNNSGKTISVMLNQTN